MDFTAALLHLILQAVLCFITLQYRLLIIFVFTFLMNEKKWQDGRADLGKGYEDAWQLNWCC